LLFFSKRYIRKFKGQKEDKRINVMKKWCRQILKGLAYLHNRNPSVIHRDLKCDNVFISSTTGCVKIGDLGLATFKTQTFAKSMRGTMEFMAPEMFDEQYDERVDIYSFGLCMLEMITGEYPYIECKGPTAVIKRVTSGLKPDCYYKVESEDVRDIIDCCIRTNKEERLSVHELLQHSFFLDDNGLRVDFVRDQGNDLQGLVTNNSIELKLKIIDKTKRKALWTEHEAIRFRYNFTSETPDQIVNELIEKKYIFDEDKNFVIQSIKDRLRAYQYEQMDRKAGVFHRDTKSTVNYTSQTSLVGQQQAPPSQQQHTVTPVIAQPQAAPVPSTTSTQSMIQQLPIEVQPHIVKPSTEILLTKTVAVTEPIPIVPLSELSSSVSGSAGSLEKLDAALKITLFNKPKTSQSVSTTSTITNDISEPPTPLMIQDDLSISRLGNEIAVIDQRQIKESVGPLTSESTTSK
jgi:WNK lysine deficient protein kinase